MTRRPRRNLSDQDRADLRADRARLYGGDPTPSAGRPAGVIAYFDDDCSVCGGFIQAGATTVVNKGDQLSPNWIHPRCHSGGDDE